MHRLATVGAHDDVVLDGEGGVLLEEPADAHAHRGGEVLQLADRGRGEAALDLGQVADRHLRALGELGDGEAVRPAQTADLGPSEATGSSAEPPSASAAGSHESSSRTVAWWGAWTPRRSSTLSPSGPWLWPEPAPPASSSGAFRIDAILALPSKSVDFVMAQPISSARQELIPRGRQSNAARRGRSLRPHPSREP